MPPALGPLGVPADPAGQAPGAGLKAVIRRLRLQRQALRTERREIRITARENLRDYKRSTGDEGGPPASF